MNVPNFIQWKAREEVLEIVRACLLPKIRSLLFLSVWILLPFFFLFLLWRQGTWGIALFFLWFLSGVICFIRFYIIWSRTILIITDMRVIDCDQKGFFNRTMTQTRFDQIDEASYQVKGFFATVFGYGTLDLQLRGSSSDIQVTHVKHPDRIVNLINDLRETSVSPLPHARS